MKKFITVVFILFIAIACYLIFSDESSKSVENDDKITLIFDEGRFNPATINKELINLLTRAGINLGTDNRYLIQDTPDFQNRILTFYLPKNKIHPQHKDYITERLEKIRASYSVQKQKTAQRYKLSFDLAIADGITPRDIGIEKFIDDKDNLKRFKEDTARYNKHYDVTIQLGKKEELASTAFGVSVAKVCAVKLDGIPKLNYTKLNLNDYLTEKTRKQIFRYSYNARNEKIELPVELKNVVFKDQDNEFVKQLLSQPNKYKIVMVPIAPARSAYSYNTRNTPTPTSASIYLTYDTVKLKGPNQMSQADPCIWPTDLVEPDPDDSNTPFPRLVGYQLDIQ